MAKGEKKDEIKKMILDSDNKALSKAVRGNHQSTELFQNKLEL